MTKPDRKNYEDFGDAELASLFASMDGIAASEELKASTLSAIFEQADAEEPPATPGPAAGSTDATAQLQTPAGMQDDTSVDKTSKRASLVDISEADRDESRQPTKPPRSKKRAAWRLKIAATVVAVAIVVGGGVAYALPVNHVLVSVDETTFDLGVNVFGTTVSVASNSEDGEAVLKASDVHNMGFRDALERLLDAYEKNRGSAPDDFSIEVSKGLGDGGEGLAREANRVFEQRREARPQQTQPVEQQPQESWREQQSQQAPSVEQPQSQSSGDQGGQHEPTQQEPVKQEPASQEPQSNQGGGQQPFGQQQEPGQQPSGQQQEPAQREPAQPQMVEGGQADGAVQGAGNQQPQGAGQPAR